jgi:hypothetical protein
MYEDVTSTGVRFTAVGVVTADPASVESILAWANSLQDRVEYVIVENASNSLADFTYWRSTKQAGRFRETFVPIALQSARHRSLARGTSNAHWHTTVGA